MKRYSPWLALCVVLLLDLSGAASSAAAQAKELLLDPDGRPISNNEFRDYSLSDPQRKDPFTRTVRSDGVVELRLKRNRVEGTTLPAFTAKSIDGKTLDLEDKVVVLNFWFIGCPGCLDEIPRLNALAAKYANRADIVFLAVTPDDEPALRNFFNTAPFNYLHLTSAQNVIDMLDVKTFPRNAVVGRDRTIVYWRSSVKAWEKFESVIDAELDTPRMSPVSRADRSLLPIEKHFGR
jgi:thiol-disulfide isomerase/thioredoxin